MTFVGLEFLELLGEMWYLLPKVVTGLLITSVGIFLVFSILKSMKG